MRWNLHPAFLVMIALAFGLSRDECDCLQDPSLPLPMAIIKGFRNFGSQLVKRQN